MQGDYESEQGWVNDKDEKYTNLQKQTIFKLVPCQEKQETIKLKSRLKKISSSGMFLMQKWSVSLQLKGEELQKDKGSQMAKV